MAHLLTFPKPLITILLTTILCSLFYILGSYITTTISPPPTYYKTINTTTTTTTTTTIQCGHVHHHHLNATTTTSSRHHSPPPLDFEAHHTFTLKLNTFQHQQQPFPFCAKNYTNYCPCHDPRRENLFPTARKFFRERHCPGKGEEALRCLVPKPSGYRRPFQWPKSRDTAWFNNVPFKRLTEYKKKQNWVRLEGDRFVFPGGGTSFPSGVKGYIDVLKQIVPLKSGAIRTVLDIGCGVASFGAALMDYNILTMSVAPRDIHEAQVQFALERGLPAMLGILSIHRLPFPARSFDMAHCSRCLVNWTGYDGLYLIEIDRMLRPGGYWVLSGPPISWRISYKGWEREASNLEAEQNKLEELARRLCWKKVREKAPIAVWQKPSNHIHCAQKLKTWKTPKLCSDDDPDAGWYKKMEACITPLPKVENIHETSGGSLNNWPQRLKTAPPRIRSATTTEINMRTFSKDNELWKRRVSYYGSVLRYLFHGRYRNIMDMNAGFGGFSAALSAYPVWVMNVVPFDAKYDALGIIYERGLLGTYMNWCEAFSTEPRTYDLIHADGIFSMYMDKCDIHDILFEMYRILRPGGAVIVRDHVDIIVKIKDITDLMRWNSKISHSQNGPFHPEKILFVDNS